jgi:phage shock protein C
MAVCTKCGNSMNEDARFCSACGTPATAQQSAQTYPPYPGAGYRTVGRLIRPRVGRMVAGVCQGLANNYGWDVTWVRVITVLLAIFACGIGLIAYIVFWIVMPEEPLALPQPNASWRPQG